jgi:DNA-binding protein HU-beta
MNKKELINQIASEAGLTKKAAGKTLDALISSVEETLEAGGKVKLSNFGTFSSVRRKPRNVRNPGTGKLMKTADKTIPHFTPGRYFRDALTDSMEEA